MPAHDPQTELVAAYLRTYYRDQPNDDVAATAAIRAYIGRHREEWTLACAFRSVLAAELPAGTLTSLVTDNAGREMEDEVEARAFLQAVYDGNSMELAFDHAALCDPDDGDGGGA